MEKKFGIIKKLNNMKKLNDYYSGTIFSIKFIEHVPEKLIGEFAIKATSKSEITDQLELLTGEECSILFIDSSLDSTKYRDGYITVGKYSYDCRFNSVDFFEIKK